MPATIDFKKTEIAGLSIPHKISVDPQSGSASINVGIPITGGRNQFNPEISLSYSSSGRNSAFGIGWMLNGITSVSIDMRDGYPNYGNEPKYSFGGLELCPLLEKQTSGAWLPVRT